MNLPSSKTCCGCSACRAICPKQAISMTPDSEGFLQPVIDKAKCIRCGKCEKVCPVLHHGKPRKPLAVYAAKAKDDELRAGSASGGIFTLLALDVLKRGGVVFGAGFDHSDWRVIHKAAHNTEELDDLRGSKYVQSDVGNTYQEAKQLLDAGKEVLYSGCPCQIAALLNFLGKPYSNLTTVDLVCHGVPSPLAWRKYLDDREREAGAKITRTHARRYCGWHEYALSFAFANDKAYSKNLHTDSYLIAYLRNWMLRTCCYDCTFRYLKSNSDITLGDDWGSTDITSFGESLVLANSVSGESTFKSISQPFANFPLTYEYAIRTNPPILISTKKSRLRNRFQQEVKITEFGKLVSSLLKRDRNFFIHLAWWLKRLIVNREVNAF